MEKEYDLEKMDWRRNPYTKRLKKQISIRMGVDVMLDASQRAVFGPKVRVDTRSVHGGRVSGTRGRAGLPV
jgi:hypothetical protein